MLCFKELYHCIRKSRHRRRGGWCPVSAAHPSRRGMGWRQVSGKRIGIGSAGCDGLFFSRMSKFLSQAVTPWASISGLMRTLIASYRPHNQIACHGGHGLVGSTGYCCPSYQNSLKSIVKYTGRLIRKGKTQLHGVWSEMDFDKLANRAGWWAMTRNDSGGIARLTQTFWRRKTLSRFDQDQKGWQGASGGSISEAIRGEYCPFRQRSVGTTSDNSSSRDSSQ